MSNYNAVKLVSLSEIAAIDDCMQGVDMLKVQTLREIDDLPPITLRRKNRQGFFVVKDGHHRVMAAMMQRQGHIAAEVESGPSLDILWRWPRIAPVLMTYELFTLSRQEGTR